MAETITYDPSNDPQAIAEAEARDGETLAVGEKMQEEQSDLLAGKYRDAEALEKAYIELQKKLGEDGQEEAPQAETEQEDVSLEEVSESENQELDNNTEDSESSNS